MAVIPEALLNVAAGVDALPFAAAIVGAVEAALVGFNQGIDAVGVGGYGNANAAIGALRQAVFFEAFPGGSGVIGAIEATTGAAAAERPGCTAGLPKGGEENVGI